LIQACVDIQSPPGTKACDAVGGAFRPEWMEGTVKTKSPSTISCGPRALLRVPRLSAPRLFSCKYGCRQL